MATNETDREIVLEREVPFSRALVWKAVTDPSHVHKWFGPDGFTCEDVKHDFRVGGVWSFVFVGPNGERSTEIHQFTEITPISYLAFDMGDGEKVWATSSMRFEETEKGTRIVLRNLFPTKEFRDEVVEKYGAVEGGKQHLAKWEAYVRDNLA